MATLLEDLKSYLVEGGVVPPDLCTLDSMPDKPDYVVTLYEYQGASPPPQIASAHYSVQIVVRAKKSTEAKQKAWDIYKALETEDGYLNITPTRWSMVYLREPPFRMKVDNSGRLHYGFNLGITSHT